MTRRPPRPSVTRLPQPPPLLVSDAFTQQCLRQINEGEVLTLGEIAERIKSQTGVCAASLRTGTRCRESQLRVPGSEVRVRTGHPSFDEAATTLKLSRRLCAAISCCRRIDSSYALSDSIIVE